MPCIDSDGGSVFLNNPAVKEALHVADSPQTWSICNAEINEMWGHDIQLLRLLLLLLLPQLLQLLQVATVATFCRTNSPPLQTLAGLPQLGPADQLCYRPTQGEDGTGCEDLKRPTFALQLDPLLLFKSSHPLPSSP